MEQLTLFKEDDRAVLSVSGIYRIACSPTGKFYIGSAVNILSRWTTHKRELARRTHHSKRLQQDWDKHGEAAFSIEVVEQAEEATLLDREQFWLDATRCYRKEVGYNIREVAMRANGEGKEYIVTFPDGREERVCGLSAFCRRHRLCTTSLVKVAKAKMHSACGGYFCRYADMTAEEHAAALRRRSENRGVCGSYEIVSPSGETFQVRNLWAFCQEKGIRPTPMYLGGANGWRCRPLQRPNNGKKPKMTWIVTHPDGREETTSHLGDFCINHRLKRTVMQQLADAQLDQHKGFLCRRASVTADEWRARVAARKAKDACTSEWVVRSPEGQETRVRNLARFCRERGWARNSIAGRPHMGWTVTKVSNIREDEPRFILRHPDGREEAFGRVGPVAAKYGLLEAALLRLAACGTRQHKGYECRPIAMSRGEWLARIPSKQELSKKRKGWIIVSPEGAETRTDNLAEFCKARSLSAQVLGLVARGLAGHYKRWKCRPSGMAAEEWEALREERRPKPKLAAYAFVSPSGEKHVTTNFKKACKQFGLSRRAMRKVEKGQLPDHQGWRVLAR